MANPARMKKIMGASLVLSVSTIALAGCGQSSTSASGSGSSKPLAVVNGKNITNSQVSTMVHMTELFNGSTLPNTTSEKANEVKYLVQEQSVADWTLAHHLTTTAKAKASATTVISKSIEPQVGGKSGLTKLLKSKGVTFQQLSGYLTQQIILQQAYKKATANVKPVTTSAAQAFYKAHPQYFTGSPQVELREITVKTQSEANSIVKQLKGGASFTTLAKKDTTNTALKSKGGEMGWTADSLQSLSPGVYKEIGSLKTSQYGVAKGSHGYDVIQLQGKKAATESPFSKVESQVKSNLLQTAQSSAYQTFAGKIVKQSKVHVYFK
ncbi:MAG: peptidyl-prolyl cis-trans isomerase [Firmicutes bacterium]|nr:peptidyl-prolyl cis-trans isomerase [Bacillota bacterium]